MGSLSLHMETRTHAAVHGSHIPPSFAHTHTHTHTHKHTNTHTDTHTQRQASTPFPLPPSRRCQRGACSAFPTILWTDTLATHSLYTPTTPCQQSLDSLLMLPVPLRQGLERIVHHVLRLHHIFLFLPPWCGAACKKATRRRASSLPGSAAVAVASSVLAAVAVATSGCGDDSGFGYLLGEFECALSTAALLRRGLPDLPRSFRSGGLWRGCTSLALLKTLRIGTMNTTGVLLHAFHLLRLGKTQPSVPQVFTATNEMRTYIFRQHDTQPFLSSWLRGKGEKPCNTFILNSSLSKSGPRLPSFTYPDPTMAL